MFIPIDAKADIQGSKKGKLTPAQHAQLNAWCLSNKTGIFDCLDRCATTSNTYSITNNIAEVVFKKGYVAICGRIVECEEGTTIAINTKETPKGYIILRYNLAASGESEFEFTIKSSQESRQKEDLNKNPLSGVYEFELWAYTTDGVNLTISEPTAYGHEYIESVADKIERCEQDIEYYSGDIQYLKDRLDELGFKSGVITFMGVDYNPVETNKEGLFKLGKNVICNLNTSIYVSTQNAQTFWQKGKILFTLPEGFRPKTAIRICVPFYKSVGGTNNAMLQGARSFLVTIKTNGVAVIDYMSADNTATPPDNFYFDLNFGFEI
jgi:hypothetical protein